MADNIVKKVCKELSLTTSILKKDFLNINNQDLFMIDTALKELIEARNIIDFASNKQATQTNWNSILKAIV